MDLLHRVEELLYGNSFCMWQMLSNFTFKQIIQIDGKARMRKKEIVKMILPFILLAIFLPIILDVLYVLKSC